MADAYEKIFTPSAFELVAERNSTTSTDSIGHPVIKCPQQPQTKQ